MGRLYVVRKLPTIPARIFYNINYVHERRTLTSLSGQLISNTIQAVI